MDFVQRMFTGPGGVFAMAGVVCILLLIRMAFRKK